MKYIMKIKLVKEGIQGQTELIADKEYLVDNKNKNFSFANELEVIFDFLYIVGKLNKGFKYKRMSSEQKEINILNIKFKYDTNSYYLSYTTPRKLEVKEVTMIKDIDEQIIIYDKSYRINEIVNIKKDRMRIQGRTIDLDKIKKDGEGYYIMVNKSLFILSDNPESFETVYLTDEKTKEYLELKQERDNEDIRIEKIKDAITNNRVAMIPGGLKGKLKYYAYLDENYNII